MSDFAAPDWDAPLDVEEHARAAPKTAQIKGMFLAAVADECKKTGHTLAAARDRYIAFQDYPLAEHVRVLGEGAPLLFPGRSLRRALRSAGRASHGIFSKSLVGSVVLGAATDVRSSVDAMVRGYQVSMPGAKLEIVESSARSVLLRASGLYSFFDSHHVGVFEGVVRACGERADVRVRLHSIGAGDMLVAW